MKKVFIPKMGSGSASASRFFRAQLSPDGGTGGAADDKELTEAEAIKKIGEQVIEFKTMLGEKADAAKFEALEKQISDLAEGIETMKAAEISKAIIEINKSNEAIHKQIVEMQEELAEKREQGSGKSNNKTELIATKDIEDFVKATFNADGSKTHASASLTIKAPETFGIPQTFVGGEDGTDISAFTGRLVVPELNQRKRKRNLILDNFDIRTINVPRLVYLEKVEVGDTNPTSGDPGGAAWILSGQAKPKRSFRVTTGEVISKKVAIFGTIEDKLLRDVPSFQNWIREDFMDEIREVINDGLLNNDPDINALAPLGLKTEAVQYTVTPAFTLNVELANYIDALIAAIASMANSKEEPGKIFVSDDVFYRIHNLKATDGKWLNNNLIYVDVLGRLFIAGVQVIPADIEDIPSTHFLLVAKDLGFKIYAYGNMVFERGLNGEDFREDKTSYRAYQEFLSYIASNRVNSVMYDTFVNVFAAITLPVV